MIIQHVSMIALLIIDFLLLASNHDSISTHYRYIYIDIATTAAVAAIGFRSNTFVVFCYLSFDVQIIVCFFTIFHGIFFH